MLVIHTKITEAGSGNHAADFTRKHHAGKIQRIDTQIQQRSSRQLRIFVSWLLAQRSAEIRCQGMGRPDGSLLQKPRKQLSAGHIPRPDGFRQKQPLSFGGLKDLLGLPGVDGKRLFTKDILPMLQTEFHLFIVMGMRCGNIHQINLRILKHLLIGTERFPDLILLGKCLCPVQISGGYGICLHIPHRRNRGCHRPRDMTGAQNSHFHRETSYCHFGFIIVIFLEKVKSFAFCAIL